MTRNSHRNRVPTASVYANVMDLSPFAKAGSSVLSPNDASAKLVPGPEFSFTVKPLPGEGILEMFRRLALALKDADTTLVKLMVFGSVGAYPAAEQAMRQVFGRIDWPVTWVEGAACHDEPIAGMQAFAFSAGQVDRITLNGRVVGSVFEEGAIRYCLLGGLGPKPVFGLAPRPIPGNAGTSGNRPGTSRFLAGRCGADLVLPR